MAKWPRRMVIDVSSRLHPASSRTPVTAATMPGRSAPMAVTARCGMACGNYAAPVVIRQKGEAPTLDVTGLVASPRAFPADELAQLPTVEARVPGRKGRP